MNAVEIAALLIFIIGVLGLMVNKNIIKSIICIGVIDVAIILFYVGINYEAGMNPPVGEDTSNMADPVVQAIMITAIVIGIAVTAVALMMFIAMYHRYGTTNWEKALKARQREE